MTCYKLLRFRIIRLRKEAPKTSQRSVCVKERRFMCVPGPVLVVPALSYVLSVPAPCDLQMKHWIHHDLRERGRKTMIFTLLLSAHPKPLFSLPALSLTHTHTHDPAPHVTHMHAAFTGQAHSRKPEHHNIVPHGS